jgi:hypothetical protein
MRIRRRATQIEEAEVRCTLNKAKERNYSGDFLDPCPLNEGNGFPWPSVSWYKVDGLEIAEFEKLYLFWDGVAWGDEGQPRQLKRGVEDFKRIAPDIVSIECHILKSKYSYRPNYTHIVDIWKRLHQPRVEVPKGKKPWLILVRQTQRRGSPLMILDGNHRAVTALWSADDTGDRSSLPRTAWLGQSSDMDSYRFYQRIP